MRIEVPVPQDDEREWRELLRYGERRARELGIRAEDVERLIAEYRAEAGSSGAGTSSSPG